MKQPKYYIIHNSKNEVTFKVPHSIWFTLLIIFGVIGFGVSFIYSKNIFIPDIVVVCCFLISGFIPTVYLLMKMEGKYYMKMIFTFLYYFWFSLNIGFLLFTGLLISVDSFSKNEIANDCIPILEVDDYNPNLSNIGDYFVLEYNGVTKNLRLSEKISKNYNGNFPECLNASISESIFGITVVKEYHW